MEIGNLALGIILAREGVSSGNGDEVSDRVKSQDPKSE
jgi:hypothetical protein